VVGDEEVDVRHVQEPVAVDARHLAVHLRDDQRGAPHGRRDDVHADAEVEEAVRVGERRLDEGDVHGDHPPPEQVGHLRQEDRGVVGKAGVHRCPRVVAHEEGVVAEVRLQALVGVGRDAQRPDLDDLGVEEGLGVRLEVVGQRVDEVLRLAAGRPDEDAVARADSAEHRLLGDELLGVPLAERLQFGQPVR